jgi:predicted RNA-binding Zn ribbon-like protein
MTEFRTGNGAAWLDLLATHLGRYQDVQVDQLATPAALRAWLRSNGLEPVGAVTAADLDRTRELREALHRAAVATLRSRRPEPADVRLLDEALSADRPVGLRTDGAGLKLRRPATVAEALARLSRDAVQHLAGPQRDSLHACGDDTCSGIFLDQTGRRRWCSDERCGNRMRVRAHRARTRQAD